jgi:hypothetical protein
LDTCTGSRNQWNIKARNLKMYSRSAKGGEKGDQNRNPWLAKMYFTMLWDIDLIFVIWIYNDELQIKFSICEPP